MRLSEFYLLSEGAEVSYTLEPESNGQGRLLAWEGGDSFEALAHGDFDQLADALVARLGEELLSPGSGDFARLRDLWDDATATGDAVHIELLEDGAGPLHAGVGPKTGGVATEQVDSYEGWDSGF